MTFPFLRKKIVTFTAVIFLFVYASKCQIYDKQLTLDDVIVLAKDQSLQALIAKHQFKAAYWQYRTYIAKFLPGITFSGNLIDFNRSITKNNNYENGGWVQRYGVNRTLTSSANLDLIQNIRLTGGSIFLSSRLDRQDWLEGDSLVSYFSTPIILGFKQPISGYNEFRWEKKIEPVIYEKSKKEYLHALEGVSILAVNYFFDLLLAQVNLEIADKNFQNADTIYKIGKGRYNIGTISENELLQLELTFLNSKMDLNKASVEFEINKAKLRSFLGFNENVNIELILSKEVPDLELNIPKVVDEAKKNNPTLIGYNVNILQAEKELAAAKAVKGINADIFANVGLTQTAGNLRDVYNNPQDQQIITLGINFPILDWGLNNGKYKMAKSNKEVITTSIKQELIDFETNMMLEAIQFNLQDDQLLIASKADTIANYRYNLAKNRFLIGKIDVTDLNIALEEKDVAKRSFIYAIREYWNYFYNIRQSTLYDFLNNTPLSVEYENIIK